MGIFVEGKQGRTEVTSTVSGGSIGGLLEFQKEVLTPAENRIGRMAVVLGENFNTQFAQGWDIDGNQGDPNFFTVDAPQSTVMSGNSTVTATFSDVGQLESSDYQMKYDGANWSLTRMSDGQSVSMTGSGTSGDPFIGDGLSIVTAGSAANGDTILIEPYRDTAAKFVTNVTDPRKVAASMSDPAVDPGATGDNRNMLALFGLQESRMFDNGTVSFDGAYSQLVAEVGTKASMAQTMLDSRTIIYEHAVGAREEYSGVNLDEEAANLLQFQQAYTAAAKVMSVADEIFKSLVNIT
ncbi:MAG: hypothetical protein HQL48_12095 [Gammaproteobacteria bacterium]|nr:hypothetical protein [Gammaproteobacteria bacterium]